MTPEEKIEFLEDRIVQLKAEIEALKAKGNKILNTFDTVGYTAPQKGLYTVSVPEGYSVNQTVTPSGAALTFEMIQAASNRAIRVGGLR